MEKDIETLLIEALYIREEISQFLEKSGATPLGAMLGCNFVALDIIFQYEIPYDPYINCQRHIYNFIVDTDVLFDNLEKK